MLYKKAVLKIFLRKHFNKNAGLLAYNLIKKTLQHSCLLDSNGKTFKSSYFEEILWTAASEIFPLR